MRRLAHVIIVANVLVPVRYQSISNNHADSVKTMIPDSKVHGANMGPIWGRQDRGGPHVGPMNLIIWDGAGIILCSSCHITLIKQTTLNGCQEVGNPSVIGRPHVLISQGYHSQLAAQALVVWEMYCFKNYNCNIYISISFLYRKCMLNRNDHYEIMQ